MPRFQPREIRNDASLDEIRRQLNEIQKEIGADLRTALGARKVTELQLGDYAAGYGDVARMAPPSAGGRLILPEPNPARLGDDSSRVTAVLEAATGALTVEVVNGTINGATTLSYAAGIGAVEFVLTPQGWYGWSATLVLALPLSALASQSADTFVGRLAGAGSPAEQNLSALAGAGLAFGTHTLDVTGSTSITITSDQVQRAALTGEVTASANSNATVVADGVIDPANLATSITFGVPFIVTQNFSAGTTGTADDVTVYNANAPFAFRIIDCWAILNTGTGGSTIQLRDTSGGGGSALSSALSSAATGTVRNNDTATRQVAANGSVFLRRSDRAVGGRILIQALRE